MWKISNILLNIEISPKLIKLIPLLKSNFYDLIQHVIFIDDKLYCWHLNGPSENEYNCGYSTFCCVRHKLLNKGQGSETNDLLDTHIKRKCNREFKCHVACYSQYL